MYKTKNIKKDIKYIRVKIGKYLENSKSILVGLSFISFLIRVV